MCMLPAHKQFCGFSPHATTPIKFIWSLVYRMHHTEKLGVTLYQPLCQAQCTSETYCCSLVERESRDRASGKQHGPPSTTLVSQYGEKEEAILQPPSITDSTPDNFHFFLFLSHAPHLHRSLSFCISQFSDYFSTTFLRISPSNILC